MMSKIISKPHNIHVLEMIPAKQKQRKNSGRVPVWYWPKIL